MRYPRPVAAARGYLRQPQVLRAIHGWLAVGWAFLTIPTVLVWHSSILWIGFMSVYAIVASHLSGWAAGEAAVVAADVDVDVDADVDIDSSGTKET